jgi:hypothetical protein
MSSLNKIPVFKPENRLDFIEHNLSLFYPELSQKEAQNLLTGIWRLYNDAWEKGYNQGKYNPDFED